MYWLIVWKSTFFFLFWRRFTGWAILKPFLVSNLLNKRYLYWWIYLKVKTNLGTKSFFIYSLISFFHFSFLSCFLLSFSFFEGICTIAPYTGHTDSWNSRYVLLAWRDWTNPLKPMWVEYDCCFLFWFRMCGLCGDCSFFFITVIMYCYNWDFSYTIVEYL